MRTFGCHLVAVWLSFGCQVGKPQYYQGFSGVRSLTKVEEKRKGEQKNERNMKSLSKHSITLTKQTQVY